MTNKPYRKRDRFIEFVMSGVFVFTEFFFIFLSLYLVYFVSSAREARADSRVASFALPVMKVFKVRLNFSELF